MTSCDTAKVTREEHNKTSMIENHLWEIAKIMEPNSYIDPNKIQKIKEYVFSIFQNKN
ncbi:MAG: hypothetical protein HZA84_06690 [Thaumarchaeota archaeon]|nr:hypothetical protein [Nitrososphaerota archaeon]